MKVLYSWLNEFFEDGLGLGPYELINLFEEFGEVIEVNDFIDFQKLYGSKIVTGVIKSIKPHPESQRLAIVNIWTGKSELQVVSGAPNLRPGLKVALGLPGLKLPGGVLEKRIIRGIESQAMPLSEAELGLEEESLGIIELPEEAKPGESPLKYIGLDDYLYDLYIAPNRGDLLGILGIARAIGAKIGKNVILPDMKIDEVDFDYPIEIEAPEDCPRYTGRVIRDVKVWPSPPGLRRRLMLTGFRSINNIVDVTNYVLLEFGHPLHAFDLRKLEEKIRVRRAFKGEIIRTLDGVDRELDEEILVIADLTKPVAIAGVIGGEDSEISGSTREVLLESAYFEPITIRRAVSKLKVDTESSRRFARGVDPEIPPISSLRATQLILETAGGIAGKIVDVYPGRKPQRKIKVHIEDIERILGTKVKEEEFLKVMESLYFEVSKTKEKEFELTVPSFRQDISIVPDIAEEFIMLKGYSTLEGTLTSSGKFLGRGNLPYIEFINFLVNLGLYEAKTVEFASERFLSLFNSFKDAVKIKNPLGVEYAYMRTTLIPGLLSSVSNNLRRGISEVKLFEVGKVFKWRGPDKLPEENYRLAVIFAGEKEAFWTEKSRDIDYYDLKGVLDRLSEEYIFEFELEEKDFDFLVQGAYVKIDGKKAGWIGQIKPEILKVFEIKTENVFGMELEIWPFEKKGQKKVLISRFPPVKRDLSLLIDKDRNYSEISEIIKATNALHLKSFWPIDIYEGEPLPQGKRSITIRLVFETPERTLTQAEVNAEIEKIVKRLEKENIKIRGYS